MESIKDRLLKILEEKKLTKRIFCQSIGVSHSYLNDLKTMQSDKLSKIFDTYPDVNLTWLITGKGEMFQEGPVMLVGSDEGSKQVIQTHKDQITELQAKLIKCMEDKEKMLIEKTDINLNIPMLEKPGK